MDKYWKHSRFIDIFIKQVSVYTEDGKTRLTGTVWNRGTSEAYPMRINNYPRESQLINVTINNEDLVNWSVFHSIDEVRSSFEDLK